MQAVHPEELVHCAQLAMAEHETQVPKLRKYPELQ
jgi:hypothetical protein